MAKRRGRKLPSRQDSNFWETAFNNTFLYSFYYDRIVNLALARFEYKNLPDTVNQRFMELALIGDGMAVYFNDPVIGDLCLRTMVNGNLGLYDIPTKRIAYSNNGYRRYLDMSDSVLIYNDYLHKPLMYGIATYAHKLSEIDLTMGININAQKTPILITANERERFSMQNLYMQYSGNQPFIFGTKNFSPDQFKVFKTDAPFIASELFQLKTDLWNEMLTWLGISNVSINKKERLITDEVQRSQGGTIASRFSPLEARKDAVDEINRMFNTNIEVSFREELDTTMPTEPYLQDGEQSKEGDSDE
jgi:hypothetical protein